jgi:hypothetical protein
MCGLGAYVFDALMYRAAYVLWRLCTEAASVLSRLCAGPLIQRPYSVAAYTACDRLYCVATAYTVSSLRLCRRPIACGRLYCAAT